MKPGDVIVANTEQGHDRLLIGYAAIVPRSFGQRGIASHHIYVLRAKPADPFTNTFLCHLLNSRQMHDIVSRYANGTTVNMLPLDGVQKPLVLVPPSAAIQLFDEFASNIQRHSEAMVAETRALATLREALLPKLIAGEIRIKDAKEMVGERV